MGAYSRWALIRRWALIQINTVSTVKEVCICDLNYHKIWWAFALIFLKNYQWFEKLYNKHLKECFIYRYPNTSKSVKALPWFSKPPIGYPKHTLFHVLYITWNDLLKCVSFQKLSTTHPWKAFWIGLLKFCFILSFKNLWFLRTPSPLELPMTFLEGGMDIKSAATALSQIVALTDPTGIILTCK